MWFGSLRLRLQKKKREKKMNATTIYELLIKAVKDSDVQLTPSLEHVLDTVSDQLADEFETLWLERNP